MTISFRIRIGVVAVTALLLSESAWAQSRAGEVFLQIFNVGSPEQSVGEAPDGNFDGIDGSAGCGGGDGGELQTILSDAGFADPTGTDVYKFCDAFTTNAMGWSGASAQDVLNSGGDPAVVVRRQQQGLAPDELFMQIDQAANLASLQITNVSTRIQAIRLARRGLPELGGYASLRGNDTPSPFEGAFGLRGRVPGVGTQLFASALQRGFSAGNGLLGVEGLSGFINGHYTRLDGAGSSSETGSEGNGGGVTLGIDKQLGKNAFLGLAFGYSRLDTEFDHDFGESDLDDYTFSLYGSIFPIEQLYVDGIVSGSILRFDQERDIPSAIPGGSFQTIDSDPEGWNITGDLGIGGEFNLEPVDLNPYVRVAVSHTDIDGFNESGSTLALSIGDQESTSVTTTVGLSASLPISTGFGVVSPYARGEYVHEYNDQADDVTGNMRLFSSGTGFRLEANDTDRDYAHVGGGVTLALGNGISAFVDYDALLWFSNLVVQKATLGGRLEF